MVSFKDCDNWYTYKSGFCFIHMSEIKLNHICGSEQVNLFDRFEFHPSKHMLRRH